MEALWQKELQSVKICIKINIFIFVGLAAHAPIKDYHVQSAVAEGIAVSMSKSEWKRCGRRDCSQSKCININIFIFAGLAAHAPIKDYHVQSAVAEGIADSMSIRSEK